MCFHYLWSTVILNVLMKSWYPGNFEVTIEKTCQSYSSIMASMRRASCCRAAPNWKNVDFSSCNDTQGSSRDSQQIYLKCWINCRKGERNQTKKELQEAFSILQSVSQTGRGKEIRERVNVRDTTRRKRKRGRGTDTERGTFSQQVRLHCKRVSNGNSGGPNGRR